MSGDGTAERMKNSAASTGLPSNPAFNLYNASLSLSYTLDVFGGTRRQVESLIAERDYEAYQLEASYLSLTANIVTAAITEASVREQIKATQEIIADEATQLDIVKKRFNLGGASRADVLLQESNLRQEESTLPPLQLQLSQTRNQLAAYAGRFPSEQIIEKFNLEDLRLPRELPVSLPSQLVAQRPDIQAAAAQLHQASANIGVAVANRLPQVSLTASTSLHSQQEFENLIIKNVNNAPVRLRDIARVTLGADDYDSGAGYDGQQGVYIGIQVAPTANLLTVADGVRKAFPEIQQQLPGGLNGKIIYDSTEFVNSSISEVEHSLLEALAIVTIVIFIFLGSLRSVVIPVIAIPLSLVGTFTLMQGFGFSINLLTRSRR